MTAEILEVQRWANNSDLIEAAFAMHVFPRRWAQGRPVEVLDPTYNRGLWWKWLKGDPALRLTTNVLSDGGWDFRSMPYGNDSFDVVAFDPDYVAPGGRSTTTVTEFYDRYGLKTVYESPVSLQASNDDGLAECARVVRPQGLIFAKCSTYISSGAPWLGEYHTIHKGLDLGLKVDDIFVHVSGSGPQPEHPSQKHARSNSSRLIVFRKPGRRRRSC